MTINAKGSAAAMISGGGGAAGPIVSDNALAMQKTAAAAAVDAPTTDWKESASVNPAALRVGDPRNVLDPRIVMKGKYRNCKFYFFYV